jgi:hypothetical protein
MQPPSPAPVHMHALSSNRPLLQRNKTACTNSKRDGPTHCNHTRLPLALLLLPHCGSACRSSFCRLAPCPRACSRHCTRTQNCSQQAVWLTRHTTSRLERKHSSAYTPAHHQAHVTAVLYCTG